MVTETLKSAKARSAIVPVPRVGSTVHYVLRTVGSVYYALRYTRKQWPKHLGAAVEASGRTCHKTEMIPATQPRVMS